MSTPLSASASALQDLPIFKELPSAVLQKLAAEAEEINISKDQTIIKKGDPGDSMFLIRRGAVVVHDEDHIFATLISGEYFGEYALIDDYTRSATVTASQPTELIRLTRERFNATMGDHPELKDAILMELIKRLRHLNTLQDQLLKNNNEIQHKNKEIAAINQKLTEINDEKTQIMLVLAHELRNTLTSSITLGESLHEEIKDRAPDLEEYIDRLNRSLWRMSKSVDRMISKKTEVKSVELNTSEFSLTALLEDLNNHFIDRATEKHVKLIFKGSGYQVTLDPALTRQILENLIGNAIRFSPGGARVVVQTYEEDPYLCISIKDQGPGLSEAALRPLLEPLDEQEDTVKNPSDISLSIVRRYTESMGGKVQCDSQPGHGATFILKFKDYQKESSQKGFWDLFKT